MKNLLKNSVIIAFAAASFAACTRARTTTTHYISATASSMGSFSSTGSSVTTDGAAGYKITIEGTSASGAKMLIYLNPYSATTGIRTLDTNVCEYIPAGGSPIIGSAHGTVTLTSVTPDIIGTFIFTGRDSSVFTGSFNAPMP